MQEADLDGAFGPYQIEGVLGAGSMAVVYLASHPTLGRVALKVPHARLKGDFDVVQRFIQEIQISESLVHPNIIQFRDAGSLYGRYFLATDLVEGPNLEEYLARMRPLSWRQAIYLSLELLSALQHAHRAGVVHRDFKPANVLIDEHGYAHIADFGLARRLEAALAITCPGMGMGTSAYVSPEQVRNARDVGPATDLYSVGILLYECVTGFVPFHDEDPRALARKHITDLPVAPRRYVPELPAELELVILKALEKRPEDRFGSAQGMKAALETVLAGGSTDIELVMPIELPPPGQGRSMGRRLLGAGLSLCALLVDRLALFARTPQRPGRESPRV